MMGARYLSVCSGIEAASVAWHPLGWQPVAFAEIDRFPSAVLAHHYPQVPNLGDMTNFRSWPDADIDVLVGGTPCQSFSVAGLRKGLADPRGNLALVFLAIAERYRPRWIVWENVPGVLSSSGGRDFGSFLGGLGELGYGWAYRVLDAQYVRVDGHGRAVPQRRRRVFVVGHFGDWRRAAAVLFERESLCGHSPPRREAAEGIARGFEVGPTGGRFTDIAPTMDARAKDGPIRNQLGIGAIAAFGGNDTRGPIDVATARNAHGGPHGRLDFESETFVAHSLRAEGFDASEDGTGRGTPLVPIASPYTLAVRGRGDGHNLEYRQDGTANAILTPNGGRAGMGVGAIAFNSKASGRNGFGVGEISPTLRAMGHKDSHTNAGGQVAVHQGWQVRRLTPRECERLQGFPDDYTLIPVRGKPAADGPRYKALGNSMAVNCMRWLGRRIEMVEEATVQARAA